MGELRSHTLGATAQKKKKKIQFTGNTGSEKQVKTPPQESNQTNPEVGHFAELAQSLYQITEA